MKNIAPSSVANSATSRGQALDFLLHGGTSGSRASASARDVAEFGVHAGGIHHGLRLAGDQRGAGVHGCLSQGGLFLGLGGRIACHRFRFAGKVGQC